jgi:transcriptional regulator with XRE-family HTH domain
VSQLLIAGIGERIAHYRKLNGWTAQQLATNTDGAVSRATIANIESGRRAHLGLEQFLAICLALRVPPVALLVDLEQPFEPAEIQFPGSAPRPLDPVAPNSSIARWLNGQHPVVATRAGRRVAQILELTEVYRSVIDAVAAAEAADRVGPDRSTRGREELDAEGRLVRQQLIDAGVSLPADCLAKRSYSP